jgi:hypothetical protein
LDAFNYNDVYPMDKKNMMNHFKSEGMQAQVGDKIAPP